MICERIDVGDGAAAIVCFGGKREKCSVCGRSATKLCDGPPPLRSRKKTCSKPLCGACATSLGEDRDLCQGCVVDAARVAAGPLTTVVEVWTARLDSRVTDPDLLNIARGSRTEGEGLAFAPSGAILWPAIRERRRANESALAGLFHDALNIEEAAWRTYVSAYLAEMLVSSNRPVPESYREHVRQAWERGVRPDPEAWARLLARPRVVLACTCQHREHSHRFLLARILGKLGATLKGELPLPAAPQLSLLGEVPRGR